MSLYKAVVYYNDEQWTIYVFLKHWCITTTYVRALSCNLLILLFVFLLRNIHISEQYLN